MKWWVLLIALSISGAQRAPESNATITGVVVRANTEEPLENVRVELAVVSLTANQNPSSATREPVLTDDSGRFEFRNLPPGRYRVLWTRWRDFHPGLDAGGTVDEGPHITTGSRPSPALNVQERGNSERTRSVAVNLAESQIQTLTLPLVPGGVITGRVQDARGRPLAGGSVVALRIARYELGQTVLGDGTSATIDDRGEFRIHGLRSGRYYLRVDNWAIVRDEDRRRYSYFPGGEEANAVPIVVKPGTEFRGADFRFGEATTTTVSGTFTISAPNFKLRETSARGGPTRVWPPDVSFYLIPTGSGLIDPERLQFQSAMSTEADLFAGRFELRGVRPGDYELYTLVRNYEDKSDVDFFVGRSKVTVGGQGVQSLVVTVGSGHRVEGLIVFADDSKLDPGSRVYASLEPMTGVYPDIHATSQTESVGGPLVFSGMLDHRYQVTLGGLPPGFAVLDLLQAGRSVLGDGILVQAGAEPFEIVVARNAGTVLVNAKDAAQRPVQAATVVMIPALEHRRVASRYFRTEFDAAKSRYTPMEHVAPGEYIVLAVDELPRGGETNADFVGKYEHRGVRVLVRARESINVDVPVFTVE